MNKKFIVLSLLLLNLKIVCGENKVIQQALTCEISYSDVKVKQLSQPNIIKYGFTGNPLTLTYHEKHNRGVISLDGKILQRLKITKQQLPDVAAQVKESLSITQLKYNKDYPLKLPLYVTIKEKNTHTSYKISCFNHRKHSEVDEAGYNSDSEAKFHCAIGGMVIGIGMGTVFGAALVTFLVFSAAVKKIYYS